MIQKVKSVTLTTVLPWLLIVGGIIGLISSFIISEDKLQLLENPRFVPNCNLNPVISCGSVMQSPQGSAFGFPNPWIGLVTFAIFITIGVALLAGAEFKRWFWLAFEAGVGLGIVFAGWLLYESIYRIQALCPYCLAVDVVMLTVFWYLWLYLLRAKLITLPKRWAAVSNFAQQHHLEILITAMLVILAIILQHFWYYYGQFL